MNVSNPAVRQAFEHLRATNHEASRVRDLTIEWTQPAAVKDSATGDMLTPPLFSELVLPVDSVDFIRVYESGNVVLSHNREVDISFGLEQVTGNRYDYCRYPKPYHSQKVSDEAQLFKLDGGEQEYEMLEFMLERMSGGKSKASKSRLVYESDNLSWQAHIDDEKIRFWFNTHYDTAFGDDGQARNIAESLHEALAIRLASNPKMDFYNLDDRDVAKLNHDIISHLAVWQIAIPKTSCNLILDSAIQMGKRRKIAVPFSPRLPKEFYAKSEPVVIPRTGAYCPDKDKANPPFYSNFCPKVIVHPSYTNPGDRQRPQGPKVEIPSFLATN